MKIAGVVVLYQPGLTVIDHIKSYLDDVDKLYVVDNSETSFKYLIDPLLGDEKIIYVKSVSNLGIADALNIGAKLAIIDSVDFLLTMDQDSFFRDGEFNLFVKLIRDMDLTKVGIISPFHYHDSSKTDPDFGDVNEIQYTMTSGNLLSINAFNKAGAFLTPLFIDHVDHEYCLRLRLNGFKIIELKKIQLMHSLGETKRVHFFGFNIMKFISHQPSRTYYMIRNGLYVSRMYKREFPEFGRLNNKLLLKEIIKIFLESHKWIRLKMVLLAIKHFRVSRLGKLQEQI